MKKFKTVDNELAHHLEQAEHHLISAVELFGRARSPKRRTGYLGRLVQAQEATTSLYREELVRIRGPQRPPSRKKAGRK